MRCKRWWKRAGLSAALTLLWIVAASLSQPPLLAQSDQPASSKATQPTQDAASPAASDTATQQPAAAPAADASAQSSTAAAKTPQASGTKPAPAPGGAGAEPAAATPAVPAGAAAPGTPPPQAGTEEPNPQASPSAGAGPLDWGKDFRTWTVVTGYVLSNAHGNRLVQTYVTPAAAAKVYKRNAELALMRESTGYEDYPADTKIAMESWLRNALGGPGKPGPVFFMRKRGDTYDLGGNNWEYAFTHSDLSVIADGHSGKMQFCKDCHSGADNCDFVWAVRR